MIVQLQREPDVWYCAAARLKRAGLDYWEHVCVNIHDSWEVCTPPGRLQAGAKT
jgi:tRNA(Leu) C34 or U34 (ribose-2'-O)-methylase TrmL